MLRGIRSATAQNLLLGAGIFFKNFDPLNDTPATATSKQIGATDGGGTFAATMAVRHISVDGTPGPVKGYEVNDGWTATLTANVKEITAESLELAMAAFNAESLTTMTASKISGKQDIEDSDYVTNITWAGSLSDGRFVYIVLKNALSLNGINLSVGDKSEAVIPVTLTAHYDPADLETPPFEIYFVG